MLSLSLIKLKGLMTNPLTNDWGRWLGDEFQADYMKALKQFLAQEKAAKKVIYPHSSDWFRAFELTPLEEVKVRYSRSGPVPRPPSSAWVKLFCSAGGESPPSLANIYKELANDVGVKPVPHGSLVSWAKQGVLLLNTALTVEQGNAASHRGKGWEPFTDRAIETVSQHAPPCVFLLWGSHARQKKALIDQRRHLVLESPHPSPAVCPSGLFWQSPVFSSEPVPGGARTFAR